MTRQALRLRAVAPLLIAAVLAGVAVATVHDAGCEEPGRYEPVADGYVLVGGCIAPGDIVVGNPAPVAADADAPARS